MRISPVSAIKPCVALVVVLGLLCCQSVVQAGALASTPYAYDDDLGPGVGGAWLGSVAYNRTTLTNTIQGTLEYAVFAPGQFQNFLIDTLGGPPPFDPAPGEVVYAYQLIDVTAATPGVSNISVGLDVIDIPGTVSPPSFAPTGAGNEQAPSLGEYNGTSMVWRFMDNPATGGVDERINTGEQSPILIFSSAYLPELDNLTINSGIAGTPSYYDSVPSIGSNLSQGVPEPSSVALLLIGCASLIGAVRRQRGVSR